MRRSFPFLAMVAGALIVVAYSNSLHNDFHFDDSHVIVNNIYIRSLGNIPRFFTDAHTFSALPQNATYRPLVSLSYAIDYAIGHGLDPVPFHVSQIILLLAVWALLIPFYRRILETASPSPLNGMIALGAATLFAVHTANSETMNFISCRSELISAIGLLAAFILVQRSPAARRYHLYLLPLAFGALAKAPVVIFAPLLMVYIYLFSEEPRTWGKAARAAIPSLITGIALLAFLDKMNAKEWTSGGGSVFHYAITQPFVWLRYLQLFVLPVGLTADTDWKPFQHWYDTRVFAGVAFVIALVLVIRHFSRTPEQRPIAFGLSWFAIALIPTSSFFPLAEVANEHRIFFPFIGLSLAAVYGIALAARRSGRRIEWAAAAAIVAIILAHVAGTRVRNTTWRTEESLWRDTAEKSPENGRALMNYGLTQMEKGRYTVAKSCFERAAILTPNYATLQINLGIVDGALGMQRAAEDHFRTALSLNDDADGHLFYGRWLAGGSRGPEAVAHLERALALAPASAEARSLLMELDAARGAQSDLQALARQSLSIEPGDPVASAYARGSAPFAVASDDYAGWFAWGLAENRSGHDLQSAIANRQALKFSPRSSDAWNNLGWSLARLGFRAQARQAFAEALSIRPDFALARNNLLWIDSLK